MVSAGVPLVGALDTLREQTENKKFQGQLEGVVKDVQSGLSLSEDYLNIQQLFRQFM
jgi:type II secretory pathway component PulF